MQTANDAAAFYITRRKGGILGWVDKAELENFLDGRRGRIEMHQIPNPDDVAVYSYSALVAYRKLVADLLHFRDNLEDNIHIDVVAKAYCEIDDIIQKQGG